LERVYDEPEDAADLAQKTALDLNDLKGAPARPARFSISHGEEVASLRDREKRKLADTNSQPMIETLRHYCAHLVTFGVP
jgi:hypothetical protein